MSQISNCPECDNRLRIPDEKAGAVVKCPKCGHKFRAPGGAAAARPRRRAASGKRPAEDELPLEDDYGSDAPPPRKKKKRKKSAASGNLQPFLKRWLIAFGVVMAVAVVISIGGLFSEIIAMIATGICVVTIIGCVLAGRIWMAIDLGKDSVLQGVGALLVPAVGLVLSYQKQGPSRRGAVVLLSGFAAGLVLGLMMLVFYPKYTGAGQLADRADKWETLIRRMESNTKPDDPVVSFTVDVARRPGALDGIEPECEALLGQFKYYVPGSLKVDAESRLISYQYRGDKKFGTSFAYFLGSSTGKFSVNHQVKPSK